MPKLVAERLVRLAIILLLVTLGTSFLLDLVPGDPALTILGADPTPEAIAKLNERYGFNDPVLVRYWNWIVNAIQGDLGVSPRSGQPVIDALVLRLPVTLQLAFLATILSLVVAIPLALITAYRAGSLLDRVVDAVTSLFISIPSLVAAIVLVLIFSIQLKWLPVTGWVAFSEDPLANLRHALLPVIALALPEMAVFQRVLRADVITTLQSDHIALAKAKGLGTMRILFGHALRVSSYSLLTVTGLRLAHLIGGAVVVEVIFAVPGIGALLVRTIGDQDLITLQAVVAVIAIAYLLINFLVDLAYSLLDPRVKAA